MKTWLALAILIFFYLSQSYSKIDLTDVKRTSISVEIKGEVKNPGVYELQHDATIQQVIKKAGGMNEEADISALNLSKVVEAESVIIIPKKSEKTCISLNQADLQTLMQLNGIGEKTATRIIEYRQAYGFQSIEEVMQVKGIKEKLFSKMKDQLCL